MRGAALRCPHFGGASFRTEYRPRYRHRVYYASSAGVRDIFRWLTSRPRDRRSVDDSVSIKCDWSTNLPLNQWFYATIAPKIAQACPIMRVADFPIRAFVEASAWYIRGKDGNDHLFKTWVHSVWPCGVVFRTDSARRCARGCRSRRHGQSHEQRLDARLRLSNLQSGAG